MRLMWPLALLIFVGLTGCSKSKAQLEAEAEAARQRGVAAHAAAESAAQEKAAAAYMAESKAVLEGSLKDPGSAQFKDLQVIVGQGGKTLCGQVNAKNSYGGYIGFRPFAVTESKLGDNDSRLIFLDSAKDLHVLAHTLRLGEAGCPTAGL